MDFNPKYNDINNLFGELGNAIGMLGDSSKYDKRFVALADRVIRLNTEDVGTKELLRSDILKALRWLTDEGYILPAWIGQSKKVKKSKPQQQKSKTRKSSQLYPRWPIIGLVIITIFCMLEFAIALQRGCSVSIRNITSQPALVTVASPPKLTKENVLQNPEFVGLVKDIRKRVEEYALLKPSSQKSGWLQGIPAHGYEVDPYSIFVADDGYTDITKDIWYGYKSVYTEFAQPYKVRFFNTRTSTIIPMLKDALKNLDETIQSIKATPEQSYPLLEGTG